MLRQIREVYTRWRRRLRGGGQASIQRELDELTRAAVRIRNLQIAIMTCFQHLAGPKGGPTSLYFPCTMQKPGS